MFSESRLLLKAPAFDMAWLEDAHAFDSAAEPDPIIMLPSGGGSTKTGVKNQVQLMRPLDDATLYNYQGFETDGAKMEGSGICSSLCAGTMLDGSRMVCTLIDDKCLLTRLTRDPAYVKPAATAPSSSSKNKEYVSSRAPLPVSGLKFRRLAEFKADHHETDPGVRSCCFATVESVEGEGEQAKKSVCDVLVTGGNDGCVRVWTVVEEDEGDFSFPLAATLRGHSGTVLRVSASPIRGWAASASEDGTFRVWDLAAGEDASLLTVPCSTEGLQGKASCMDVAFGHGLDTPKELPDEKDLTFYMYSLQCPKKGPAQLIKWHVVADSGPGDKASKDKGGGVVLRAAQEAMQTVCNAPAKRLAVSATGLFVACGCSDGAAVVVSALSMRKYGRYLCHDLPVTGLAFAPDSVAAAQDVPAVLTSVSADCRIASIPLGGVSPWMQQAARTLFFVIVLVLMLVTAALLSGFALPPLKIQ